MPVMDLNSGNDKDGFIKLLMISTTLRGSYDEWICKPNFADVLNTNTNSTCLELKRLYPAIDNKASQSIALAVILYTYFMFFIVVNSSEVSSGTLCDNSFLDLD